MQAEIKTRQDGSVAIELDSEAARAVVASIIFAARFHEGIAPLAGIVETSLQQEECQTVRRRPCQ